MTPNAPQVLSNMRGYVLLVGALLRRMPLARAATPSTGRSALTPSHARLKPRMLGDTTAISLFLKLKGIGMNRILGWHILCAGSLKLVMDLNVHKSYLSTSCCGGINVEQVAEVLG